MLGTANRASVAIFASCSVLVIPPGNVDASKQMPELSYRAIHVMLCACQQMLYDGQNVMQLGIGMSSFYVFSACIVAHVYQATFEALS